MEFKQYVGFHYNDEDQDFKMTLESVGARIEVKDCEFLPNPFRVVERNQDDEEDFEEDEEYEEQEQ